MTEDWMCDILDRFPAWLWKQVGPGNMTMISRHTEHILNRGEVSSLSVTQLEEVGAEWGWDAESKSVDDNEGSEGAEDEHPEPEEDVDLLVEDVDRQDAERVVLLQLPGGAKLVKSALCQPSFNGFYYWLAAWTRTRRVTWERCRPLGQFCPPGLDRQRIKPDQLYVAQLKTVCYCKTENVMYFLNNWPVKCP